MVGSIDIRLLVFDGRRWVTNADLVNQVFCTIVVPSHCVNAFAALGDQFCGLDASETGAVKHRDFRLRVTRYYASLIEKGNGARRSEPPHLLDL